MRFWQVDAFTSQPFKGNPAAVFVLTEELPDTLMQNIAIEMNLSETAFILLREGQNPLLRWFTPMFEIDLCGHATLASTHVYLSEIHPELNEVTFDTRWVGPLHIVKKRDGFYTMNFPSRLGDKVDVPAIPQGIIDALGGAAPAEAYKARDLMLVYEDESYVRDMAPDFNALMKHKDFIIVTAQSDGRYDFISRFFCADDGIAEDPVTGSAHCTLAPYWSMRLGKTRLLAYQASKRGGELELDVTPERIFISGPAITVLDGNLRVEA